MNKQIQQKEYRNMMSKKTDKQLLKEIKSFRKYFQSHSQYLDWHNLNPADFGNNDRFLILRELLSERGLKEE